MTNTDKALEYQQVAALLCKDVEIAYRCAHRHPENALEFFKLLKEQKDKMISDPEHRKMRYDAGVVLYNLVVRSRADK